MPMLDFQSANFRLLSRELIAELSALGSRHGIKFNVEKGTVGSTGGTITMRVALVDNEKAENAQKSMFAAYARMFSLQPEWFGQQIVISNVLYRITGINPRAKKFPILLERIHDGASVRCPAWTVQSQLAKKAAA